MDSFHGDLQPQPALIYSSSKKDSLFSTNFSTTPQSQPSKDPGHTGVMDYEAGSTSYASPSPPQASTSSSTAGSPCLNHFDFDFHCMFNVDVFPSPHTFDVLCQFSNMLESFWPSPAPAAQQQFPEFMSQFQIIKESGLPNFMKAKIPVSSGLNVDQWESALQCYHDKHLCMYLRYGWPVGYLHSKPPVAIHVNHNSALEFPEHVSKFIDVELSHHALLGPFSQPPFQPWNRLSPLMTRPKKNSLDRRVIVDLSFPPGSDVNSGIDITNILGQDVTYTLPSISDLIAKLQIEGPGAFIWKADLSRAYRQFRIDPLDAPLMGIQFNGLYYIDRCPAFGCRSSSAVCQRVANALVYILAQAGHFVLAYLDDFAGCSSQFLVASEAFTHFINVSNSLGLDLASNKCMEPSTSAEWLGYNIDTVRMCVSIPHEKMSQVMQECELWAHKKRASKVMIQSLLGKLVHISNCIPQARKFVTRILATLRAMNDNTWVSISEEFRKDIYWFLCYAKSSNGILLYTPAKDTFEIECDSSLMAGGGCANMKCYSWIYPQQHMDRFPNIHELEAVNLLVSYKTFTPFFHSNNALIIIYTDNMASSYALESGRTKDSTLAACARELWLLAAKNSHQITIRHKPGSELQLADALSRISIDPSKAAFVHHLAAMQHISFVKPALHEYQFFNQFV